MNSRRSRGALVLMLLLIPCVVRAAGNDFGVSDAVKDLESPNPQVREAAVSKLVKLKILALDPTIGALTNSHPEVRMAAADVLGQVGDPYALPPLLAAMDDPEQGVRGHAATALGNFKDARVVHALLRASGFNEKVLSVRLRAMEALAGTGDPLAVVFFVRIMKDDPDPDVQTLAAEALSTMTGQSFGRNATDWMRWMTQNHPDWLAADPTQHVDSGFKAFIGCIVLIAVIGLGMIVWFWKTR